MKIIIQLAFIIFIGTLTPVFIGLLFLVTPLIWLWRKFFDYFGREAITDIDNPSSQVKNSSVRDGILWSS